ncbi:hypothetical protein EGR_04510 [Echinococcus granulosus]|uniref:Uncharacterized protein n=1 Tax=Echinococcus granulosus TaxID=6210 RepID=W6UQU1_ECHGR|nr:hypothetical protein EGR_04510 [Echinococcus granulosus]EUB60677.1 hypothetical protein EGR_04510 [Echinococcus granulosus]
MEWNRGECDLNELVKEFSFAFLSIQSFKPFLFQLNKLSNDLKCRCNMMDVSRTSLLYKYLRLIRPKSRGKKINLQDPPSPEPKSHFGAFFQPFQFSNTTIQTINHRGAHSFEMCSKVAPVNGPDRDAHEAYQTHTFTCFLAPISDKSLAVWITILFPTSAIIMKDLKWEAI